MASVVFSLDSELSSTKCRKLGQGDLIVERRNYQLTINLARNLFLSPQFWYRPYY